MKVGPRPQSLLELAALATGVVPQPVFDTLLSAGLARTVMAATKAGVFEALRSGPSTVDEIVRTCGTAPGPTEELLGALAACGYVERDGERHALTAMARKYMLADSSHSLTDHVALMYLVWRWLEHYETYLRTGQPLDVHATLAEGDWGLYQRGMKALAGLSLDEFIARTKVPAQPRSMIDVGGSHGAYSAALCRRHPTLRAEIVDLPEAMAHVRPLIEEYALGERLVVTPGDARTYDFGTSVHDIALLSNVCHHFDDETNAQLVARLTDALVPGGVLIVQEPFAGLVGDKNQVGALGAFYFAMLSESKTWTTEDVAGWCHRAGLRMRKPVRFYTVPGFGQVVAEKSR